MLLLLFTSCELLEHVLFIFVANFDLLPRVLRLKKLLSSSLDKEKVKYMNYGVKKTKNFIN